MESTFATISDIGRATLESAEKSSSLDSRCNVVAKLLVRACRTPLDYTAGFIRVWQMLSNRHWPLDVKKQLCKLLTRAPKPYSLHPTPGNPKPSMR